MPLFIQYLLKFSISMALVYSFYQLFLRRLTFYNCNRWYLLGYVVLSFFIPFIDRQSDSMKFIRTTALLELFAFTVFLLMPGFIPKLVVVIAVNLFNTGWYSILQGRLYSSLPGQSASIMAIGSVTAPLAKFFPFLIGLLADQFGLQIAMWVLILGPIALLMGLPKRTNTLISET